MRFCPFCSAENSDDLAVCQACGRRLPPAPGGRRNAPATGINLPPRRTGATVPPASRTQTIQTQPMAPIPKAPAHAPIAPVQPQPPADASQTLPTPKQDLEVPPILPSSPVQITAPPITPQMLQSDMSSSRTKTLSFPPAPPAPPPAPLPAPPAHDDARRQLANALNPSPAAQRRDVPDEPRIAADRRRPTESQALSPTALVRPKSPSPPPPSPPSSQIMPALQPASASTSTSLVGESSDSRLRPPPPPVYPVVQRERLGTDDPPPTRIQRGQELVDRPFSPPQVLPIPEIPEPNLIKAAKYTYVFARARWQRRGAIKQLGIEIKQDTEALDGVLGALGRAARGANVEGRVFSAENTAISMAEERIKHLQAEALEVDGRKAEENSKFIDVERERNAKLADAQHAVDEAQRELGSLEAQRRTARDKRKELERRQRAYLKAAEDSDRQSMSAQMGDARTDLRRVAEGHRREAAALEPERQDVDRRLGSLERPIAEVSARLEAGKAELETAKRSLSDAREGHTHRLAELDAEQKRKLREIALAEAEIQRRLVTLGTLVNLNRVGSEGTLPGFGELYERIDRLRGAITARTTEIEKLTAEREAYDRGTLVRGVATIGGALVALIALVVVLLAIL